MRAARSVRWISMRWFLPVFAGEKSPELGTAAYQHPGRTAEDFDASIDDYSIATISTTLHALALEPGLLARYNRGEGLLLSPREIVRHGCAAHAECLALFEKAGDAVRYRIARLLESPLMRLPNLKPLVRYAVCGPETPADRGELFVRDGLWGFKIRERELIPPIYDAGFDFSEGLAAVRTERCWHFIDPTGAVAIDCSDCKRGKTVRKRPGDRRPRRTTSGHRPQGTPNHLAYLTANNYLYPKNTCSDRVVSRQSEK